MRNFFEHATIVRSVIVVKLGGSVASNVKEILSVLQSLHEDILIVPGGWIFADLVEKIDVDDEHAHWMAILAMEQYGYYISSFGVKRIKPKDFDEIKFKGVRVLLPYELLINHDELPHSWDVTSDSIAVWIASKLKVDRIVKLTDVDGIILNGKLIERIQASKLVGIETCLDSFAPKLMVEHGIDTFICNGHFASRVKDYITKGRAKGTLVEGR